MKKTKKRLENLHFLTDNPAKAGNALQKCGCNSSTKIHQLIENGNITMKLMPRKKLEAAIKVALGATAGAAMLTLEARSQRKSLQRSKRLW